MTTEQNESPSEPPAEMPARKEGKKRGCLRGFLIALFVAVAALFSFMIFLSTMGRAGPEKIARYCGWNLHNNVYKDMLWYLSYLEEKGREFPPDWTIPVLIQEMYRGMDRGLFSCPIQGERDPYLAFPAPVSVLLNPAEQEPVPVVMCRPGNHREFGTPVLYSDGTVKSLTTEEAEKLVAERSPVPIEEVYRNDTEENRVLEEADTALPAPAQLKTEEK